MNQALFQVQGVDGEKRPDVCPCGHNLPNEGVRVYNGKLASVPGTMKFAEYM